MGEESDIMYSVFTIFPSTASQVELTFKIAKCKSLFSLMKNELINV